MHFLRVSAKKKYLNFFLEMLTTAVYKYKKREKILFTLRNQEQFCFSMFKDFDKMNMDLRFKIF